jgi:hypothetical protein
MADEILSTTAERMLLAATPEQLAELRAISEVFDISPDESAPRG